MPDLSILICTYRRETWLGELLDVIAAQEGVTATAEVIVVDNDPAGGAKTTVTQRAGVQYHHEPRPGVSHARNTAVAASTAPLLLMLDDDQLVEPDFVARLLSAWQARPLGAAGLRVQVLPLAEAVPPTTPPVSTPFAFVPVDRGTFGTGGLLVIRSFLAVLAGPFDPSLGLTGGEDTDFFIRAIIRGLTFFRPNGVVVHERIQPHRLAIGYQLQREFRAGRLDRAIDFKRKYRRPRKRRLGFFKRVERWMGPEGWTDMKARIDAFARAPDIHLRVGRALAYRSGSLYWMLVRFLPGLASPLYSGTCKISKPWN